MTAPRRVAALLCVALLGVALTYEAAPAPEPLGLFGACCFDRGMFCKGIQESKCTALGGTFQGVGTSCGKDPCFNGACCSGDGSCSEHSESVCLEQFGVFHGIGSSCGAVQCAGACCDPRTGECTMNGFDCFGVWQGPGTVCSPDPCPQPSGACCSINGSCSEDTEEECSNAGGTFQGDFTTCTPNPCPQPNGACCSTEGSCTEVTEEACASASGAFEGDFTTCTPNPCPQPSGACCSIDGSCTEVTEEDCQSAGGTFEGDFTTCAPNPCPQPNGACCYSDGSCDEVPEGACTGTGGTFEGDFTTCAPNPCAQPGACCILDATCVFMLESNCAAIEGTFRGAGLECDEVVCPLPGAVLSEQKISQNAGGFGGGPIQGGHFGGAVGEIGDVDGDGVMDLAVGEPLDGDGGSDAGAVWIIFLNTDGTVKDQQKISATQGGLVGPIGGDRFGRGVAGIGDLDNDSVPDLAVGAPLDNDGGSDAGSVWILFLNDDGTVKDEQKISNLAGGFVGPLAANDEFGAELAEIGDLDQDGVSDLAVGAYGDDDGGSASGSVFVLFLNADGTVKDEQKISNLAGGFGGALAGGDNFGLALRAIDDLDGDGITDLAVGAPGHGGGGIGANGLGAVWILFLEIDGTVKSELKIAEDLAGFDGGLGAGDTFGRGVASPGDLNGDGLPDLVVGAPGDDDGGLDAGAAYVLFLRADGSVIDERKVTEGAGGFGGTLANEDRFGGNVASLGDLDGDGVADVAVAAPLDDDGTQDSGAVWILFLDGSPDVTFTEPVETPAAGAGDREATGDLDGDGDPDVVIVIPGSNAIQVFLNNGTTPAGSWLGFTPQLPVISVGSSPSGVAIGFLDVGPDLDVAVSNQGDDTVSVLLGDGEGGLALDTTLPVGNQPSAVAIADFANDAAAPFEIAVTNQADDTMVVLENASPLAPGLTTLWQVAETVITGDSPVALEPEDVDNDKDMDGVVLNHGAETVTVSLWQSAGEESQFSLGVGAGPVDLAAGDLDGDGLPEIVTANEGDGTVSILRNTSTSRAVSYAAAQPETVGQDPSSVALADLDNDGDSDIVVTAVDEIVGPAIIVLENHSEPSLPVFSPPVAYAIGAEPAFVVEADLDGDGVADLVTVNTDPDQPNGGSVTGLISQTCPGDTDEGGSVGFGDLTQILLHWGTCPEPPNVCPWDVNGDGTVGFADLTELLLGWGDCD